MSLNKTAEEQMRKPKFDIDAMCSILKRQGIESSEYTDCTILYTVTFDQLRNLFTEGFDTGTIELESANSKHSEVIEDRERLAKLAEKQAEDLRIARIDCMNNAGQLQEANARIKELEGMVALKDDALKAVDDSSDECKGDDGELVFTVSADAIHSVRDVISATAETVQAFRDKLTAEAEQRGYNKCVEFHNQIAGQVGPQDAIKLASQVEPLRREVAMLMSVISKVRPYIDGFVPEVNAALCNTQATAQAYEQEVEARGARKALEEAAQVCENMPEHCVPYECAEAIRATSKKG